LKPSIIDYDFEVYKKLKVPVKNITKIKIIAKDKFEGSAGFIA
jgi:hypothetical protein